MRERERRKPPSFLTFLSFQDTALFIFTDFTKFFLLINFILFKNFFQCLLLLLLLLLLLFCERETEREWGRGRERGRYRIQSRLRALHCQHRARCRARPHELWDHDLSQNRLLTRLSHPGAPKLYSLFCFKFTRQSKQKVQSSHISLSSHVHSLSCCPYSPP